MRQERRSLTAVRGLLAILAGAAAIALAASPIRGDEPRDLPSRLGRLFGINPRPAPTPMRGATPQPQPQPQPTGGTLSGFAGQAAVETPRLAPNNGPRLVPQPRVSRPITEADPLLTRIAVARSDNGNAFAMFLQVFTDGTVIDAEGVHRVPVDQVRAIHRAIVDGDLLRRRGHCGSPSTDYIDQYHVTTFERTGRTFRSNTFSYTSNTQGCDASVIRLNQAIETLVTKMAGPAQGQINGAVAAPGASPTTPPELIAPTPRQSPAAPVLPRLGNPVSPTTTPEPDAGSTLPPISVPNSSSIPLTPLPDTPELPDVPGL